MKRTFAGLVVAGTLATGGAVVADKQIDPYTETSTKYEIVSQSAIPDAGEQKISADKTEPKITLEKWGGQVAMGVKYTGMASTTGSRPFLSKNVEWNDGNQKMEAVPIEATATMEGGGMEINIVLNSEPTSNIFNFSIEGADNLNFFHQAPLWQEAGLKSPTKDCTDTDCITADGTQHRPDNVVDSYAVYYKDHANHIEGQTNYATGKAYHIFRPLITDSKGLTAWANLSYSNGVLSLIIPQTFLANATYPVNIDPTFGYTTGGGTATGKISSSASIGSLNAPSTAISGAIITKFSVYAAETTGGFSSDFLTVAYSIVSTLPNTKLGAAVKLAGCVNSTSPAWADTIVTNMALTGGTTYDVAVGVFDQNNIGGCNTGGGVNLYFDSTSGTQRSANSDGTLPTTWTDAGTSAAQYSMYATYEPSRTITTANYGFCRTMTALAGGNIGGIATTTTGLFPLYASTTLANLAATSSGGRIKLLDSGNNTPLDIAFVDEATCSFSGTPSAIPHYFEKYASTTGAIDVHLGISNVSSTSNKVIAMYYGYSGAIDLNTQGQTYATTSPLRPVGVWDMSVPGFATTTMPDFTDSTYNGSHLSSVNVNKSGLVSGYVDGNFDFDGSNDRAEVTSSSLNLSTYTVLFWFNPDKTPSGVLEQPVGKAPISTSNANFVVTWDHSNASYQKSCSQSNSSGTYSSPANFSGLNANTWGFITCTYDGTTLKSYLNGVSQAAVTTGAPDTASGPFVLGADYNIGNGGYNAFTDAMIDDVRVYSQALHVMDILTIYNNTVNSKVFWTFGSETTPSAGGTTPSGESYIIQFQ